MANGDAPAPDVPHFDTRFLVQTPDGSTATQVLRTDRPISTDELMGHLTQQGSTFLGYPDAPATAAPPPAPTTGPLTLTAGDAPPLPSDVGTSGGGGLPPAPADATPAPDVPFHPTAWQRAKGIYLPERSFTSQLPSVVGATAGATLGGFTGPLAPIASPVLAAVGSGLGEAGDIAYEKLTGSAPAEPAGAWQRIGNATIRGGTMEAVAAPVAAVARPILRAATPVADAVGNLLPVLRQDLPAAVQGVENAATGGVRSIESLLGHAPEKVSQLLTNKSLQLSEEGQQNLFRAWWQRQAGNAPEKIADAWEGLTGSAQSRLAGPLRDDMQTVINTLATGQDLPKLWPAIYSGIPGAAGTAASALGHPVIGAMVAAPGLVKAAGEAVPYAASRMLTDPTGAAVLSWLPRAAQVAAPLARAGVQSAGTYKWPLASTMTPGP